MSKKVTYRYAPDVEQIARDLIADHHPHLDDSRIEIRYVFRSNTPTVRGRARLGCARAVTGLAAFMAQEAWGEERTVVGGDEPDPTFYLVEISEDAWADMPDEKRRALVDHELCHLDPKCRDDGSVSYGIRSHDLEEFAAVVRRHGLWKPDVEHFGQAVVEQQQLNLEAMS